MQEKSTTISRGYILVIFLHSLHSVERDDDEDIENITNYFDTGIVAEDESIISTYIIRTEKIGDQYQFQKCQSTFCLPKTRMKTILKIRMN